MYSYVAQIHVANQNGHHFSNLLIQQLLHLEVSNGHSNKVTLQQWGDWRWDECNLDSVWLAEIQRRCCHHQSQRTEWEMDDEWYEYVLYYTREIVLNDVFNVTVTKLVVIFRKSLHFDNYSDKHIPPSIIGPSIGTIHWAPEGCVLNIIAITSNCTSCGQ